jgi:hypothetical protein
VRRYWRTGCERERRECSGSRFIQANVASDGFLERLFAPFPAAMNIDERRAHDRRPLSPGFRGTCRTTREGDGLPEGPGIPAGITHDLVLLIDLPARRMEREERLLSMHDGDLNKTLDRICWEGGGHDARFLLAHGADANYINSMLRCATYNGHVVVVEALLDAGACDLNDALVGAAACPRPHSHLRTAARPRGRFAFR